MDSSCAHVLMINNYKKVMAFSLFHVNAVVAFLYMKMRDSVP